MVSRSDSGEGREEFEMITRECKHNLPMQFVVLEMKAPPCACLFCHVEQLESENGRLMELLGQAMNPPSPPDMRADYLAAWLHLTNAGVPVLVDGKPATLGERAKLLAASRDEARRFLAAEMEHNQRLGADNMRRMQRLGVQYPSGLDGVIDRLIEERNAAEGRLERMEPIRSLLADWEFAELDRHDLARNDQLADRVCEALKAVEVNEAKVKEGDTK